MSHKPLASNLVGKKIGKWIVKEKRKKDSTDNTGLWSTCYTVQNEKGELAFMKAYNYFYAFGDQAGSADKLKEMTENFTYERDLLKFCKEHKMKRIVSAIDSGEYIGPKEFIPVPYLVFEIAQGNLKRYRSLKNPDLAWKLKAFHGTLVGLRQLHNHKIVHQDIKPSNILIFGKDISKISDLGSATQLDNESRWQGGDLRYAPIELLYDYFSPDWDTRRIATDLFMMGGIITFMVADSNFLSLMFSKIPEKLHFRKFGGSFSQAIPFLLKAYYDTLEDIKPLIPEIIRKDLISIIAELSFPIPEQRGNPQNLNLVRHKPYSLERYISIIDRLAKTISWMKND